MKNIGLTEKIEKPNRTESVRFGSVAKSNRFRSVLQKIAKIEPNRPMLTPTHAYTLSISTYKNQSAEAQ